MENCIFISFDDNYADYAKVCLNSLAANYPAHPVILVLYTGSDPGVLDFLRGIDNLELLSCRFDTSLCAGLELGPVQSPVIFSRYMLWSDVFDAYNNILHLDCDTIVLGPLDELFETEDFFAVYDNNSQKVFVPKMVNNGKDLLKLLREDGVVNPMPLNNGMMNAGIFVLPRRYRTPQHYNQLWHITRRYNGFLAFADQSAISIWCYLNQIKLSDDYRYNFLTHLVESQEITKYEIEDIKIIHFAFYKPNKPTFNTLLTGAQYILKAFKHYRQYLEVDHRYDLSELSIIVPVRIESADRLRNMQILLEYIAYYFKNYEMIVVEQGPSAQLTNLVGNREGVVYHFIETAGPNYKTRNLNVGLALASREFGMMIDVDVICRPESIVQALEKLRGNVRFVSPHNGVMTQVPKEMFSPLPAFDDLFKRLRYFPKNHDQIEGGSTDASGMYPLYGDSEYDSTGGCLLFARKECILMGGWNPNMVSYGFEDMEFVERIKKFGYRYEKMDGFNLYHLEHERFGDSMYNNFYRSNQKEYQKVHAMPLNDLKRYVANGYKEIEYDLRHELSVTNTREKYSIEILRAAKTDLFDLSVIASGAVETPAQAANLMVFLNYMEELYNGYEIIMIDFDARPRFAQLPNLKNVRYFNLNGASRSEDAVVDFAASKTNRKYLAYWNYQSLPDPKTIKEKMAELESKKRMVEIMNGGDYVYRGIKNKHFKGIKLFPNENAYSLV